MTRKRKNVESDENPPAKNGFEGYGYSESKTQKTEEVGTFPNKNHFDRSEERSSDGWRKDYNGFSGGRGRRDGGFRRNDRGGGSRGRGGKRGFDARDFEKQYGRVGGNDDFNGEQDGSEAKQGASSNDRQRPDGDGREFPKEIVGYLRSIEQIKKKEGKIEDFILEKCAEEVAGQETVLLAWTEAAVVVEAVFGSCPQGAALFLSSVSRLKHKTLADLMFGGASARTIENLIYAMCPIADSEHVELLQKLSEILIDNWADAVIAQPSSFLIRAIVWVCCGLSAKPKTGEEKKRIYKGNEMKTRLKKVYDNFALLAFDENLNQSALNSPNFITLFQDFIEADGMWNDKRGDEYVKKKLEKDDIEGISNAWYSPNGSRIWEKLMETCSEDSRSLLWLEFCSKNVSELTDNKFSNFPLQKIINSSTSLEMVTEIVESMSTKLSYLIDHQHSGVFLAFIRCAGRHPSSEKSILQQLRKHFRSASEAKKGQFLLNVLTLNKYDGSHFDAQMFTPKGTMLVSELVNYSKTKTLCAGFEQLTERQIQEMCCNKNTSRLIQAVLNSKTMSEEVKEKIIGAFDQNSWETLITDTYGSRVFEKIWSFVDVKRKQEIMKVLVEIHNTSKFWKFAMLRCDLYLFRKSRKEWVEKMKKANS
ncbi:Protein CBG26313 [Caenorhabditis briggsae]|uniref:Protein CBG26313 n=1 Tax=Caenorhabditis briggsae TaxID=6238 RepID=B6IG86_CAEBR|nr:Protein CBG26313 [Caenorhabditis briggsae]CAR98916.1 Protein CBG26313 [Caenorhabditis briggsae]